MTKKVSSGEAGDPASNAAMPLAIRLRSASAAGIAASIVACTAWGLAPASIWKNARSAAATGANVAPPAASQCAVTTLAASPSRRVISSMSRDFPSPGEPSRTARRAAGLASAASSTARRRTSSLSRPTNVRR